MRRKLFTLAAGTSAVLCAGGGILPLCLSLILALAVTTPPHLRDVSGRAAFGDKRTVGRVIGRLSGAGGTTVAFSSDGSKILTAGGTEARVWDARTLEAISATLRHDGDVRSAVFSPDGGRVASAAGNSARVWDSRTGRELFSVRHAAAVTSACFSPDGRLLLTASRDGTAGLWDASDGSPHSILRHQAGLTFAGLDATGRTVLTMATAPRPYAHLWDVRSGRETTRPLVASGGRPAFSPDGKRVATVDLDRACVFDVASGRELASTGVVYSAQSGEQHGGPGGPILSVNFSPDGKRIVIATIGWAQVYDARTGELLAPNLGPKYSLDQVNHAVFSPDGRTILTCAHSANGGVDCEMTALWDIATALKVCVIPAGDDAEWGAFSPNGVLVAVACNGGGVKTRKSGDTVVWSWSK